VAYAILIYFRPVSLITNSVQRHLYLHTLVFAQQFFKDDQIAFFFQKLFLDCQKSESIYKRIDFFQHFTFLFYFRRRAELRVVFSCEFLFLVDAGALEYLSPLFLWNSSNASVALAKHSIGSQVQSSSP